MITCHVVITTPDNQDQHCQRCGDKILKGPDGKNWDAGNIYVDIIPGRITTMNWIGYVDDGSKPFKTCKEFGA